MTNPFTARWTAQGHTLCLGHWEICFNQQLLELPSAKAENHMDTRGIFSWLFPDDEEYIEAITREKFESLCEPSFKKCFEHVIDVLN